MMRSFIILVALVLGLTGPLHAADDVTAAQNVIRSQVDAFSRDDAAAAYALAAPGFKSMFPEPDSFMAMVRRGYAPVYRHKSFEFAESTTSGSAIQQKVHIVDADGVPWDALYTLEPQPDGSLKISGCVLLKIGQAV